MTPAPCMQDLVHQVDCHCHHCNSLKRSTVISGISQARFLVPKNKILVSVVGVSVVQCSGLTINHHLWCVISSQCKVVHMGCNLCHNSHAQLSFTTCLLFIHSILCQRNYYTYPRFAWLKRLTVPMQVVNRFEIKNAVHRWSDWILCIYIGHTVNE